MSLTHKSLGTTSKSMSKPKSISPDGFIMDIITVEPVKDSPKEKVRQEIARQLIFEYQIAPESMEPDFRIPVEGKSRKLDIAIFEAGKPHGLEFLRRAVVCWPAPNIGARDFRARDLHRRDRDGPLQQRPADSESCSRE